MSAISTDAAAEALAQRLVEAQLAACVQVIPMKSFYVWQGESRRETECLLLVKTRAVLYAQVEAFILANHPYDAPEILQLPVAAGSAAYLRWLDASTKDKNGHPL